MRNIFPLDTISLTCHRVVEIGIFIFCKIIDDKGIRVEMHTENMSLIFFNTTIVVCRLLKAVLHIRTASVLILEDSIALRAT